MKHLLVILFALVLALPAFAVDYLGTEAQFTWDQPGTVVPDSWIVLVKRGEGDWVEEATVTEKLATVIGQGDEVIQVAVKAVKGTAVSEMSVPSEPVTFRVLSKPEGVVIFCWTDLQEVVPGWFVCPPAPADNPL